MSSLKVEDVARAFMKLKMFGFVPPTKEPGEDAWLEEEWLAIFTERNVPAEVFAEAIRRACARLVFWPKPVEVLEIVSEIAEERRYRPLRLPEPRKNLATPEQVKEIMDDWRAQQGITKKVCQEDLPPDEDAGEDRRLRGA